MKIINTYLMGVPVNHTSGADGYLMAVLSQDGMGGNAVYLGIVNFDLDSKSERDDMAHWVAYNGTKQSYKNALSYFPGLDETRYRR